MEKNAASLVMQGKILGYRVLLTGDVEKKAKKNYYQKNWKEQIY